MRLGLQSDNAAGPFVMTWMRNFLFMGGYLPVVIPALVIMLLLLAAWQDRRRLPAGSCHKCGYNLHGNVSGRCPECGIPVSDSQV